MENKIIDMLLEIKADVGDLKQGQAEIKYSIDRLDGRVCTMEDEVVDMRREMSEMISDISDMKSEMSEMRSDIGEIKTTVNALSEGLLTTSREVKELKGQR